LTTVAALLGFSSWESSAFTVGSYPAGQMPNGIEQIARRQSKSGIVRSRVPLV
jgi:hypothetical protein